VEKRQACKNVLATLSCIGVMIATGGCNVGPDYVRPKVPVNANWSGKNDPRLARQSALDVEWWKQFDDPTLNKLVELARHQNLTLQIAALRIVEARALVGIAVGDQLPENVGPVASAEAVKLSEHGANTAAIDRFFGQYQVGFDALYEIDFWGKFRRGARSAAANYLATVADYDDALVLLTAEVARTYVTARSFEELIAQARDNVGLQLEGQQIAQSRFENGATSELDLAQATNLLETTRSTIPKLQIGLRHAENALSALLGRNPGYVRALLASARGIPTPPTHVTVSVPAKVLRRRPDIRSAELKAAAQCERIGIAKADLYPSFVLFGSIGTQTSSGAGATSNNSSFKDLFAPGSLVANAGGDVFWPVLRYPQILNNVRAEDARFQQAIVFYMDTVVKAAQEVEDGITGFLRQQEAAEFAQRAVTAAELSVELSLVQYREGATDYQRVLDSQRVLLASQNALIDTRSEAATNLIALYKALGGGWELRPGDRRIAQSMERDMRKRTNWGSLLSEPKPAQPKKASAPQPNKKTGRR